MHNTINPGQSRTVSLLCIPFNCRISLYPPSILSFIRSSQIRHGRIKSIVMERAREGAALSRGQVAIEGRRGCGRQQVAGRGRRLPALRAAIQPRCVTTRWCALRHRCTYVAAWEMQFCRYTAAGVRIVVAATLLLLFVLPFHHVEHNLTPLFPVRANIQNPPSIWNPLIRYFRYILEFSLPNLLSKNIP